MNVYSVVSWNGNICGVYGVRKEAHIHAKQLVDPLVCLHDVPTDKETILEILMFSTITLLDAKWGLPEPKRVWTLSPRKGLREASVDEWRSAIARQ